MRKVLLGGTVQAATRLKLGGFTSALAVNLLDRFIASQEVQVSQARTMTVSLLVELPTCCAGSQSL